MSAVYTEPMKSYNIPFDPVQLAERSLPNYTTAPDFRLLPCAIDEAARLQPTKPFASIPVTTDIRDGFRDVSFGQLGNAINRATAWLEENNCQSEPLAYLAPSDLRHIILAVAAVKVGCNMLLLSPRNSPEGNLHLLESVQCTTILTPHASLPGLSAIIEQRTMRTITVPGIHEWLAGTPAIPRPFSKSFGDMRHKPFVIVHSSGSTGLPKPIALTHGFYAAMKSLIETPHPESIYNNILRGGRLFNGFPFFHAGGLFFPFVLSLYFDIPVVLPPVGQPLSAEATDLIYQYGDVQSSCLPPAILQGLVKKAQSLQRLRRMRFIITGGALLPKSFGDAVRSAGTEVYNMIASTESGMMQHLAVGQDEWEYMRFGQQSGVEFKPHSDGLYEMVIVRKQALGGQQAVFELFPDIDSFSTKDLFSPHPNPQKSDFWLCQGRIDDVLVLLNAEKVNPTTMEMVIESSPDVKSALVMGQDRFQTCLLLDPMSEEATGSPGATQTFLDNAWPYVEQANRGSPSHARILRPLLFVTTPSKPMCRTSKGTVNRRQTTKLYAEEVDSLYQEHKLETVLVQSRHSTELMPVTLTRASLRTIVAQTLGLKRDDFAEESNFFASGMDSLLVLELIRSINHALGKISIDPGDIYMNPTLADLWSFIQSMNRNHTAPPSTDRASRMRKVLDGFALDLPLARGKASRVAILTGSTGGLGAYLLRSLIKHAGFSKIYCLNRTAQLPDPKIDLRVEYLRCDFSEPHFGLQAHVYSELLHNVTHILHNAWQVDFNLPLECFSNHLQGVRNFIDFAANSSRSAHIFFISSVASVLNGVADTVEEKVFNDFDMAQPMGYGESKHIAERLLYRAGLESNVSSSICRVGQIAGPVYSTGTWNKREWLPSMIASSKYLNCIPCALGPMDRIDWVPIDAVSQVAVELFTMNRHAGTPTTQVFHLVNPSETYWSELLPTVHGHLGAEDMPVVSLVEWVQRLKATISFTKDIERNPAVKLIDFFSGRVQSNASPIMETKLSVQYSQTLRRLDKISPDQMRLWMEQWSF